MKLKQTTQNLEMKANTSRMIKNSQKMPQYSRKGKLSLKSKEFDNTEEEIESLNTTVTDFSIAKSMSVTKKSIKKEQKIIQWIITPIYQNICPQDILYVTGEILLDFNKRNKQFSWESTWNDTKKVIRIESDYEHEIILLHFDQQLMPFISFKKQATRFKDYPNTNIHQFGEKLLQYEQIYDLFQNFMHLSIKRIKESPQNLEEFLQRGQTFDILSRNYYKNITSFDESGSHLLDKNESISPTKQNVCEKQEKYFFFMESYPDLKEEMYLGKRIGYSRSLSNLLGTNQLSLLNIAMRKGVIEFYDFETSLALNKRITEAIVNHFSQQEVTVDKFSGFQDIKDDCSYHKFYTFDEIEFYARIRLEYITLDSLLHTPKEQCQQDYYSTIIFIEPSPQTICQIHSLRQGQKALSNQSIKQLESDIPYTVQSEYFVQHFHKITDVSRPHQISPSSICGVKDIS